MVNVLFGFDIECMHFKDNNFAKFEEDTKASQTIISRINQLMDKAESERTFFILGKTLKDYLTYFKRDDFLKLFPVDNPLLEFAQHSYNHLTFKNINSLPDKKYCSEEEFIADVRSASILMEIIFGNKPVGLRVPYGYYEAISEDLAGKLKGLGLELG